MPILPSVTILGFLVSLAGKILADALLTERIPLLGSFAGLHYVQNSGIAYGITLLGPFQLPLIVIALCLVVALALRSRSAWERIGFGLILGGAFGNIVDRLQDGLVTDFFQVGSFPVFNVADSCITVGVVILLLECGYAKFCRP